MTQPVVLTSLSQFREVAAEPGPVVVDFSAPGCGPCRRLAPLLDELAARYDGRVRVALVDVADAPEIAEVCRIRGTPTLLAFKGGEVVRQMVGFGARAPVEKLFEELATD